MSSQILSGDDAFAKWQQANYLLIGAQMRWLRLLLHRRILWLRRHWQKDPLQSYQGLVISDVKADRLLFGEDIVAEKRFYREDPEASAIGQSIIEAEKEIHNRGEALGENGTSTALGMLGKLFGLTNFERQVLVLCLAIELDPSFEKLYAYVQDDVNLKYATPQLSIALFGSTIGGSNLSSLEEGRNSFLPEASLRRFKLINLDSGPFPEIRLASRPIYIDGRIADYLRGINRLDGRIAQILQPVPDNLISSKDLDLAKRLSRSVEVRAVYGALPVLNLIGNRDAGKRSAGRAVCDFLGLQLYQLDPKKLPSQMPERMEIFRLIEREALLTRLALYIDLTETSGNPETAVTDAIIDLIENSSIFLIIGCNERLALEREALSIRISRPDSKDQIGLWQQALEGIGSISIDQLQAIAHQFDFGPRSIAKAVAEARGLAVLRARKDDADLKEVDIIEEDLWQACRNLSDSRLGEVAQRIVPASKWEDIVLPEEALSQLREIAAQVVNRPKVYDEWGFGPRLNRGKSINALFSGPSGTGKTMAAEILASDLNLDLYRIDLAGVVSKYIGETEKNLSKVFDAAEQSGAILFFDEADALFGKRTEVKDSHDRYANIEINYLLQRMEEYKGLAILATNRKSVLDQAFLRRLRFVVDLPFPSYDSRRRIWQRIFPPQADLGDLDYNLLARMEISGGNIRNIAVNASFLAASGKKSIEMKHIIHAARREYAKIGKLITEAEFGPNYKLVSQ